MLTENYQHAYSVSTFINLYLAPGADEQLTAGVLGVLTASYQHVHNAATLDSNNTLGMLAKSYQHVCNAVNMKHNLSFWDAGKKLPAYLGSCYLFTI